MAKNQSAVGWVRPVEGFTTGIKGGSLIIYKGWPGVVQKDITGTTEDLVSLHHGSVKGPPGFEKGDGKGDIQVEGVFKFVDQDYPSSPLADGDAVDRVSASGVVAAVSGSNLFVGYVAAAPYDEVVDPETLSTIRYVDVKLVGQANGAGNTVS